MRISTIHPKYILLKPVKTSADKKNIRVYDNKLRPDQVDKYILDPASKDLCAVDIETRGLSPFYKHVYKDDEYVSCVMGIGFGWSNNGVYKAAYINLIKQDDETIKHILKRLSTMHLIAHNAMFDGLWLRYLGLELGVEDRPNWVADTFGLFKQFAPQDFELQSHGLKAAQISLLGWDEKGDVELDEWLITNGYYKESGKKGERIRKAAKGEMWRVPTSTLGVYCGLDCISTLQLFDKIFERLMKKYPMMWDYSRPFIRTIHELIDQVIHGVRVDVEGLEGAAKDIEAKMSAYEKEFFEIESIQPYLKEWRGLKILGLNVPKRLKKNGEVSKNYLSYLNKVKAILKDTRFCFNIGSDPQLQWLFYSKLYKNVKKDVEYNYRSIPCYELESPKGSILLPATKSGQPPIDKQALPWLGEAGAVVLKHRTEETTLNTFILPYLKFTTSSTDGRMHPGWTVPQAVTGRLGGSKPNFQQITGDKRVLKCIKADPGFVIVEADFRALEDYVAANITQCPGLLSLYGPDAIENDGHLWLGSQLPVIGPRILASGYSRDNPTKESISIAKAECKKERDIAKKVKYSATYGIGAFKLWQDLMSEGINVSLDEVAKIKNGYWKVFSGMNQCKWDLKDEWARKGKVLLNAIGRPAPIGDHHSKDVFSRVVQGGGHDLNMMFGEAIADLVLKHKINARPFIYNLHDAVYYQVHKDHLDQYLKIKQEAEDIVWNFCKGLGWNCVLKTSESWGETLKELKD
jgi:DNA polymerase I-like protein with 3'-5' exonuclease and polymerase domains